MAECKSCGDSIKFIRTESGKTMPVNAAPMMVEVETDERPDTCVITPDGKVIWGVGRIPDYETKAGVFVEGYTSHFATCPNAEQHRKD